MKNRSTHKNGRGKQSRIDFGMQERAFASSDTRRDVSILIQAKVDEVDLFRSPEATSVDSMLESKILGLKSPKV